MLCQICTQWMCCLLPSLHPATHPGWCQALSAEHLPCNFAVFWHLKAIIRLATLNNAGVQDVAVTAPKSRRTTGAGNRSRSRRRSTKGEEEAKVPKERSSKYRGVTKHKRSGRYAHKAGIRCGSCSVGQAGSLGISEFSAWLHQCITSCGTVLPF